MRVKMFLGLGGVEDGSMIIILSFFVLYCYVIIMIDVVDMVEWVKEDGWKDC